MQGDFQIYISVPLMELTVNIEKRDLKTLRDFDEKPVPSIQFNSETFQFAVENTDWKCDVNLTARYLFWAATLINNNDDEIYFPRILTMLTKTYIERYCLSDRDPTADQFDHFLYILAKKFWPYAWSIIHTPIDD